MLLCHSSRKSRKSEAVRIVIIGKTNGYCWDISRYREQSQLKDALIKCLHCYNRSTNGYCWHISRYREQSRLKDALINCTSLPQTQSVDAPINQIPCVDAHYSDALFIQMPS